MTAPVQEAEVLDVEGVADTGNAVALRREAVAGLIRPVAKPSEVLQAQEDTRSLVEQALKSGRDFDTIPGTSKPTLLKPGAERVNAAFGCAARYRIIEREVDHDRQVRYTKRTWEWHPSIRGKKVWTEEAGESQGLYRYVLICELQHRESGVVIGEGVGSCSTMESKYIDRPRDLENTVLKMAKKRAYIDATLTTFGLSEQFTQDVEDMDLSDRNAAGPFSLDTLVGFGKHKDKTWAQVVKDAPDYVSWAIGNMDKLTDEAKRVLAEALEDHDVKMGDAPAPTDQADAPAKPSGSPPKTNGGRSGAGTIACPKCGGPMWDNRAKKESGQFSEKSPDLSCKDRDGCNFGIWIGGWRDELLRDLNALLTMGNVSEFDHAEIKELVESKDPAKMLDAHRRVHELMGVPA